MRDSAAHGNLAGGIGPSASLAGVAENGLVDLLRLHSGALQRGLGGSNAHVDGGQRGERSPELANRGADGGEDVDSGQRVAPDIQFSIGVAGATGVRCSARECIDPSLRSG